ncbi:Chromo domain-containing protein [Fusarium sp. LHS14.1]|nr:Chromo domain-containing protein [Fusarium sp. LHS14.1]
MPQASSRDLPSNQGKFTALTPASRRSTSDGSLLVVDSDIVEASRGVATSESDEDEADGELGDGLFLVETIRDHRIDENGNLMFQVKWKGFESEKELTWEPEENLKVAGDEILDKYFDTIGGRLEIKRSTRAVKTKVRKRTITGTSTTKSTRFRQNYGHGTDETFHMITSKWSPPSGLWEDEIEMISACEEDDDGKLIVYLIWKNGQKTKHDTKVIYKKCPQKMLQFYEAHVKIIEKEDNAMRDGAGAF